MNELMWRYALWPFAWRAGCSTLVAAAVLLLLWLLLLQPQQQALAQRCPRSKASCSRRCSRQSPRLRRRSLCYRCRSAAARPAHRWSSW